MIVNFFSCDRIDFLIDENQTIVIIIDIVTFTYIHLLVLHQSFDGRYDSNLGMRKTNWKTLKENPLLNRPDTEILSKYQFMALFPNSCFLLTLGFSLFPNQENLGAICSLTDMERIRNLDETRSQARPDVGSQDSLGSCVNSP